MKRTQGKWTQLRTGATEWVVGYSPSRLAGTPSPDSFDPTLLYPSLESYSSGPLRRRHSTPPVPSRPVPDVAHLEPSAEGNRGCRRG